MIDGSGLSFSENIALSKVADCPFLQDYVTVEGELAGFLLA